MSSACISPPEKKERRKVRRGDGEGGSAGQCLKAIDKLLEFDHVCMISIHLMKDVQQTLLNWDLHLQLSLQQVLSAPLEELMLSIVSSVINLGGTLVILSLAEHNPWVNITGRPPLNSMCIQAP